MGHGKRHPFILTYRTGVTKEGRITALDVQMTADAGAYVFLSPYVILYALVAAPGPYRVDNLNVYAQAVATNNMYTSAFRGFGALQACAAYEQQMDEIAAALGLDRLELRRRNFLKTGEPMSTGFVPPSAIWTEQCAEQAWAALGEPAASDSDGPIRTGRGLACYQQSYGRLTFLHDTSEAWVGVEMDGTVGGALRRHRHRRRPDLGAGPDRGGGARRHPGQRRHLQQRFGGHPARRHDHGDARALHDRQCRQAGGGGAARPARRARGRGIRRRAGRNRHGLQPGLRHRRAGDGHAPRRAGQDLRGRGHPSLGTGHLPRAVLRFPRSRDRPGPGASRLCLRRPRRRSLGRCGTPARSRC